MPDGTDCILCLCMLVNNETLTVHFLTVHGEFLRGGGKRGLLSNAEPRCPLAWPPSTENVAPTKHKHNYVERFPYAHKPMFYEINTQIIIYNLTLN